MVVNVADQDYSESEIINIPLSVIHGCLDYTFQAVSGFSWTGERNIKGGNNPRDAFSFRY